MKPSCKLPCSMNSSSTKMLQTMENERFELKNAANTVEMAASSSKMLQIAREMDRTGNIKTKRKKNIPKQFRAHSIVVNCLW